MGAHCEDSRRVISFNIGHSGQQLSFDVAVISHLDRHRQTRIWHREAGGLLFARIALPTIDICAITGPRRGDRRSRYSYRPDERAEQRGSTRCSAAIFISSDAGTPMPRIPPHPRTLILAISPIAFAARTMP
jgi:hypothetical protein